MDFFEHQDVARRRTGWLIFYFVLAIVAIIVGIYFAALFASGILAAKTTELGGAHASAVTFWNPQLFLLVAFSTIGVIAIGSLYKTAQLAGGGEAVALMMGGRRIDLQTVDLAERRLLNVVAEMALASGTPVPPVYVMDAETNINAFAAGFQPSDAVIGVSRGCLDFLNREELQGVMAHEFSHILHGDMRLNLRLVGVLHGILVLALLGRLIIYSMRFSGHRSRRSNQGSGGVMVIVLIGISLLVIGSIGLFFGKLIKSAVSRQREFLADASAVQFTRLADGIAGALKKIGGRPESSKIKNVSAEEISHMFFGNWLGGRGSHLLATHPPLAARIGRIEPNFDGTFPTQVLRVGVTKDSAKAKKKDRRPSALEPLGGAMPIDPSGVLQKIGVPGMEQLLIAAVILEEIPEPLRDASQEPYGARAIIYAILLDQDPEMRKQQLRALEGQAESLSFQETVRLAPSVDHLPEQARLPLIETATLALKNLSPEQYLRFRQNVDALIKADNKINLLEYTVRSMVLRQLDTHFGHQRPVGIRHRRIASVLPYLVRVLSTLAHAGQKVESAARKAFEKAMAEVSQTASLLPSEDCSLSHLDAALKALAETSPKLKRQIFAACVACIAADATITTHESQLIQAVGANLEVPVPPLEGLRREN